MTRKRKHVSDGSRGNSLSTGVVVGIGIGCGLLVMSLVGVGIYAIRQKKRAEKAIGLSKPFGNQHVTSLIFLVPIKGTVWNCVSNNIL